MEAARASGRVAVRADAGFEIGLGHLARCSTLLRQLRIDGFEVCIISGRRLPQELSAMVAGITMDSIGVEDDETRDAERTLEIVGRAPELPSWVVVDHYGLGERWERIVRAAGHRILAIDDFRDRAHCADLLVSDADAPFGPALSLGGAGARELTGPRFALVDPAFAFSQDSSRSDGRRRLLITYGGSDPTDETSKALKAIRLLLGETPARARLGGIDVVVGPENPRQDGVRRACEGLEGAVVHFAPGSLAPLMRRADVVLTAGGNSMVETLTMRKPCLVTVTSENQDIMVRQLSEKGAIRSLGAHASVDAKRLADAVASLLLDYDPFAAAVQALPLFDHHGARRISEAMRSMTPAAGL